MSPDWREWRVQDLAERVAMGPFGSSIRVDTFVPDGVPVISGRHLNGSRLVEDEFNYVSAEHAERLKNSNAYRGDVVFTHAGNIGQVAVIPETSRFTRYVLSQRQFKLTPRTDVADPRFLAYYFTSPKGRHQLLANASSTGVPSIARPVTYLRSLKILLPPIEEQRAIASVLGALDDKIELNRRMNETLEALARAIFTSWFVDFDPVRARAEERQPIGMDAETAALFPDSFEDSPLGPIPSGWECGRFSDILGLRYGKALKASNRNEEGIVPVYGSNGVVGTHDSALVDGPGIVIGRKGTAGSVHWSDQDFYPIDTTFFVQPVRSSHWLPYLHRALARADLPNHAADSAVPGLNRQTAESLACLVPPESVIDAYARVNAPLRQRHSVARNENELLARLRDALLPKLVAGEIRLFAV